jgi:aspartate kinase
MIVCKFGGSSVDGAAGIERVAGIIRDRLGARPIVVVSAMAKTTRRLLDSAEAAAAGSLADALTGFEELREFHRREAEAVVPAAGRTRLAAALARSFGELRTLLERLAAERRLTACDADAAAAHGEVLASEILALALPRFGVEAAWIDARQVMVTDAAFTRARPLYGETDARLRAALLPAVERGTVPVLGGYIGATRHGVVTTLGKEGSDFSAAIVGAAVGASEVQIWTDVDGILTADPRLVPGARRIHKLSFAEALELACSGAKKPHPGTLGPAGRAGVPIRILNSLDGGGEGTLIDRAGGAGAAGAAAARASVKSLACRPNDFLLHVAPRQAARSAGEGEAGREGGSDAFASRVLAAVESLRPALLVLRLDGEGALLALDRADRLAEVREALGAAGEVGVLHGRAVVSLVSADFAGHPELVTHTLAAAGEYQPRLVTAGVATPVVRCLVELEDMPAAVADLHLRLFPERGAGAGEPQGDGRNQR